MNTTAAAGVTRWRKKPTIVEAIRVTEDNLVAVADWISDSGTRCDQYPDVLVLAGGHHAYPGSWVVRFGPPSPGFVVCGNSNFADIFEPAGDGEASPSVADEPPPGHVLVSREDLRALLAWARQDGGFQADAAVARLSAAAEMGE